MEIKTNIEDVMQVKKIHVDAIKAIGFKGNGPQDEQKLFDDLKARKNEIQYLINEHEYLIISPNGLYAAAAVSAIENIPEGMEQITIPADTYQVFRFEEKYIGDFWDFFCNQSAQAKYDLNVDKIRFEIFKEDLQPNGITEIYFPINTCKVIKRGFTAIGTRHEAKYSDYPTAIPQAFETLTRRLEEISNRSGATLTLYEPKGDFAPDNLGTFYATAQVEDIGIIPEGLVSQITPEQTYAVYTHRGEIWKIGDAYGILDRWIAENGYTNIKGWIVELMDQRFNPTSPESELEIYMPIEEK